MIAALYVRVSTDMQAEDGFSIAAQTKLLKDYCVKNDIVIHKIYADEGISGQKENRPEFQAMIADAEQKQFDIILVHKYDRFARKYELSNRIEEKINKAGVLLISITEPIENSPFGFLQKGIMQLFSEYFIRNLSAEVKKGLIERASQGLHTCPPPYGYELKGDKVVIHKKHAEIVQQIYKLYMDGCGYHKIIKWLYDNSIPTVKGRDSWSQYALNYMLTNVFYTGKVYYDGKVYPGQHDPIIDENIFNQVQAHIKKKSNDHKDYHARRGANFNKYLLLGLLYCGECGHTFRVQYNKRGNRGKPYATYICNSGIQYKYKCGNTKHTMTHLLEERIERYIEEALNEKIPLYYDSSEIDTNALYIEKIEKLNREIARAKEAYLNEAFTLEEFINIQNKKKAEISETEKLIKKLPKADKEMIKIVDAAYKQYKKADTIEEKKKILFSFIKWIKLSRKALEIRFYK